MEVLDVIRQDVLKQKEEEAVSYFSRVSDLRAFIAAADLAPDVNVSLKMCCLSSERLNGDNGTRITVTDAGQRGLFEATFEGLMKLAPSKRKQYIAQITMWDAKGKKGYAGKANMQFLPGGLYQFCYVNGVMFYADTPSGRVQYDRGSLRQSPAKKKCKAKLREAISSLDFEDAIDLGGGTPDDASAPTSAMEESGASVRTRSSDAPRD